MRISREQMLAYRLVTHGLDDRGPGGRGKDGSPRDVSSMAVLATGVQDAPPGRSAPLAVAVRAHGTTKARVAALIGDGTLALAYTIRGSMHVHPGRELGRLMSGLRVDDGASLAVPSFGTFAAELEAGGVAFGAALHAVAGAMSDVMADGLARTKGELSGAITPAVEPRLAPWCAGCGVHHVHDGLFRFATLQAGLRLIYDPSPSSVRLVRATGIRRRPAGASRAALIREFLRLGGPTTPALLGIWLGLTPVAARAIWPAASVVEVDVGGARRWLHRHDAEAMARAGAPQGMTLLPPYDPWLELADRELLVPDKARRREIWRAAQNPGVVLAAGEVAGVWRHTTSGGKVTVRVRPFESLNAVQRTAIEGEANNLAGVLGTDGAAVTIEAG